MKIGDFQAVALSWLAGMERVKHPVVPLQRNMAASLLCSIVYGCAQKFGMMRLKSELMLFRKIINDNDMTTLFFH